LNNTINLRHLNQRIISCLPTKWRSYRDRRLCDVTSLCVYRYDSPAGSTDFTSHHIVKLAHQGQHWTRAESDVYGSLVFSTHLHIICQRALHKSDVNMFSGMYVRPLSVKCPYLKNYGALRPMYKSPYLQIRTLQNVSVLYLGNQQEFQKTV